MERDTDKSEAQSWSRLAPLHRHPGFEDTANYGSLPITNPPVDLRTALDQRVYRSLTALSGGLVVIFMVVMITNLAGTAGRIFRLEILVDILATLVFGAVFLGVMTRKLPQRWANPLIAVIGWVVLANVLVTVHATGQIEDLTYAPFVAIVSATFFLSWRWLVVCLVVACSGWAAVGLTLTSEAQTFLPHVQRMFAGVTLGVFIHWMHLRNERRAYEALAQANAELYHRQEVQAALRRERNFLDKLIESAPVIVLLLDEHGCIVSYNPALADVVGTEYRDLVGLSFFDRFTPAEDKARNQALLADVFTEQGVQGLVGTVLGPELDPRQVEWYGRLLTDRRGEPAGGLLVGRDVTHQVQDRQKRALLQTQLQQAQKMEALGSLAGGIAHDMNNILGAISGFATLLVEELPNDSESGQDACEIAQAAKRGGALTRSLLALSRRHELSKQQVQLNDIVCEVKGILERTIEKTIALDTTLEPDLAVLDADPHQLSQTLLNLSLNAAQAMEGGGQLNIRTRNRILSVVDAADVPDLEAGPLVELQVVDTGVGIPADLLDRVMEPFFTTKSVEQGSGLGLAMVYSTVKAHRGHLRIDSQPGSGTTVTVWLPVGPSTGRDPSYPGVAALRMVPGHPSVLLIDDEPQLRKVGERLLRRAGCEVLLAENGEQGLEVLSSHREEVELVILDMRMPIMDGPTCYARIRELAPQLPVLVATGFADEGDTEEILAQGAVGVLHKPFTGDQLVEATRRAIEGR